MAQPSIWGEVLQPYTLPFSGDPGRPSAFNWFGAPSFEQPRPPGRDALANSGQESGLLNVGSGMRPFLQRSATGPIQGSGLLNADDTAAGIAPPSMLGGPSPSQLANGAAVSHVEDQPPRPGAPPQSLFGNVINGFQDAFLNPMTLGGLSLLSGGDMNSGINAGLSFLKQRRDDEERRGLTSSIDNLPGLTPADRQVLRSSPTLAQNVASKYYENRFAPKTTDLENNYRYAVSQGYPGTFFQYQTELKRAGSPQTYVNTDMRAENAEAKGRGEGLSKRLNAAVDDGVEAQKDYATLQRLSALTANIDPGTKTALLDEIRERTGVALDPNTDNVQAFKSAVNYLAPRMRVSGSGSSSDKDVQMFFRALPGLLGTSEGNQLAIQTLGGMAQNRVARGDIAQRWQRGEITAAQVDQLVKQLPDPFDEFKKKTPGMSQPQAGQLKRLTPQQAQKLPKGTRFMTTDGRVLTVQ